jgi:hypothetical protein
MPGLLESALRSASSKENMEYFLIIGDDEQILGRVFHFKTVPYFQSREIGYSLFYRLHGKGIMSEAVALLTRYLFETTLLNRLEIHMEAGNTGSEKSRSRTAFNLKVSRAVQHTIAGALSMSRCMPCCAANGSLAERLIRNGTTNPMNYVDSGLDAIKNPGAKTGVI